MRSMVEGSRRPDARDDVAHHRVEIRQYVAGRDAEHRNIVRA